MSRSAALSRTALVLAIWTAVACLLASTDYNLGRAFAERAHFGQMLRVRAIDSYSWAILSLFIWWSVQKFPLREGKWRRHLPLHICFALIGSALQVALLLLLSDPYGLRLRPLQSRLFFALADTTNNLVWYAAWVGITSAFIYYRAVRDRELAAETLQAQLVAAQLKALKMQLNPHFLFNTLNSISALMRADVELADVTMEKLAGLLRLVLNKRDRQFVTLQEEIELLETYLEIEQVRFGPRLNVVFHVEPETLDASVPDMILQPLLENAIVHGTARPSLPNHVRILAQGKGERLILTVENDSELRYPRNLEKWQMGSGLESVVLRLQKLYPEDHRFVTKVSEQGRVVVEIRIPLSLATADMNGPEEIIYAN